MTTDNSLPAWTKWALAGAVVALVGLGIAYEEMDIERHVPLEKMPPEARGFVETNFGGQKVVLSKKEQELFCKEYEVILDGGTKIKFDRKGRWTKVDCKYGALPMGILPARVERFLQTEYAGGIVTEAKRKGSRLKVEIDDRMELTFDRNDNLVGFDD